MPEAICGQARMVENVFGRPRGRRNVGFVSDSIGWGTPGVHNETAGQIYASSVSRDGYDPLGRAGLAEPRRGFGIAGFLCVIVAIWLRAPSDLAGPATYACAALFGSGGVGLMVFSYVRRRRWKARVAEFVYRSERSVLGKRVRLKSSSDFKNLVDAWQDPSMVQTSKAYGLTLVPEDDTTTAVVNWVERPAPDALQALVEQLQSTRGVVEVVLV